MEKPTGEEAYKWLLRHEKIFNVSEVENFCEIKQGTLNKAIKRNTKDFSKNWDKLIPFVQHLKDALNELEGIEENETNE